MKRILVLAGARTPFCAWSSGTDGAGQKGGALKGLDPFDLGAAALRAAIDRAGLPAEKIDKVIFGNMYHVGPNACYGARYVGLRAGLPESVPCATVNFACGTGLLAVIDSAREIECGSARIVATGGADNVSLVRRDVFVPSFKDLSCGEHIGKTAQDMAREFGVTREDQDRWALRSHERALQARSDGLFKDEIVPVASIEEDDHLLTNLSPGHFASSKTIFDEGSLTHANTHGIVDGGSALILAEEGAAREASREPLGRYLGGALIGLEPRRMAYASVPAIRRVLDSAGLAISDIDLFEINETFAAQVLIDAKELGIPHEKLNVNGGAIALGHPFAATGCRLVLTLLKELKRRGLKRGVASICVGGGQGAAVAVEAA